MAICIVCRRFYENGREYTCADERCHRAFVALLISQFGEFRRVRRMTTGVAYKVPTIDIIERVIKEQDLDRYPIWEDATASRIAKTYQDCQASTLLR